MTSLYDLCMSTGVLYAAHVQLLYEDVAVGASATALGQICVWRHRIQEQKSGQVEVLAFLSGHLGSVFALHISSPTIFSSGDGRISDKTEILLASCGDDRTIKLWDVSGIQGTFHFPQYLWLFHTASCILSAARCRYYCLYAGK